LPGPLLRREFRLPRSRPASIATVSTAGRRHLSAMAVRPGLDWGCHGCYHVGRLLRLSLFRHCSCCSWGCSFQERSQILWSPSLILISADRCRDTGTDQWICCWLPSRAGAQDLLKVPGRATVCIPVPQAVSHWAAIHCCHFAWQFSTKLGPRATNGIAFNPREPRYIEYSNDKAETNLRGGPESKPLLNYHYIALKWRLSG